MDDFPMYVCEFVDVMRGDLLFLQRSVKEITILSCDNCDTSVHTKIGKFTNSQVLIDIIRKYKSNFYRISVLLFYIKKYK